MCFLHTQKKKIEKNITQNKTFTFTAFLFHFLCLPNIFFLLFQKENAFMRGIKTYKKGV